ncbi:MAG: ATP synthase F0 subunit C [Clostridia bacterium]|nr:ATP synthase F0 subunit C [Clostridia bacterium]
MEGLTALAAGLAVFTGVGAALGMGMAISKAAESIARQPEASGKITTITILGAALIEATAIYGFVTALLLIFSK